MSSFILVIQTGDQRTAWVFKMNTSIVNLPKVPVFYIRYTNSFWSKSVYFSFTIEEVIECNFGVGRFVKADLYLEIELKTHSTA